VRQPQRGQVAEHHGQDQVRGEQRPAQQDEEHDEHRGDHERIDAAPVVFGDGPQVAHPGGRAEQPRLCTGSQFLWQFGAQGLLQFTQIAQAGFGERVARQDQLDARDVTAGTDVVARGLLADDPGAERAGAGERLPRRGRGAEAAPRRCERRRDPALRRGRSAAGPTPATAAVPSGVRKSARSFRSRTVTGPVVPAGKWSRNF